MRAKMQDGTLLAWSERIHSSIAKSRKVFGGNFVQLATVNSAGAPSCRTIVFRGFFKGQNEQNAMRFITNAHAEKVHQAKSNNKGELVWWFSESREQYRISGELETVGPEAVDDKLCDLRRRQWRELSDKAREQFFWPKPRTPLPESIENFEELAPEPGIPIGGREADGEGEILPPPDTFVVLLLWPTFVKYLDLKLNYAQEDELVSNKSEDEIKAKRTPGTSSRLVSEGENCSWQMTRVSP
mmetsp:Transcript_15325/g.29714  ORF Transcript_15325/g.29714 Transcript_15325/m.29714 type:complete len:242 (+) Transcript_15325:95-820(+)